MAEGTEGQEDRDDDFTRGEMVYSEALEINDEDCHGKRNAGAPEDIAGDDRPEGVIGVREDFGNDAARRGGDNSGDDGEKPAGCHGGKRDLVNVHSVDSVRDALAVDRSGA